MALSCLYSTASSNVVLSVLSSRPSLIPSHTSLISKDTMDRRAPAMAWDPRAPATLLLPTVDADASNNNNKDGAPSSFFMNTTISHDGVGCNTHETSCLMNLLDANDVYLESKVGNLAHKSLSKVYRKALCECLEGWDKELASKGDDVDLAVHTESLELLKIAYAVTHLSETFLLLAPNDSALDYYENTSLLPGAVTADTVRYLRLHHMGDASAGADESVVDQMLDSLHPDQVGGGTVYWKLVVSYLVRGCLEEAWALLSRHSICRRSFDDTIEALDEYHETTLAEDREGFLALRDILLSAPLPGGRNDEHDDGNEEEEGEDEEEIQEYLEGIPASAYRLWETGQASREGAGGDYPATFNPHAAQHVYRNWKQALAALPALHKLKRRVPQLNTLLAILSGDFKRIEFDSWAEALCAELLYKLPNLRPDDMNVRAARVMEQYGVFTKGGFEEVVLSVMKGNAGRVIQVMHELGGGSGAALPAVMTSLLCHLLTDAHAMPKPADDYSLQTELLLNASFAIRSSLAVEGHHDLGTRLAVRLLLPHVKPDGDLQIAATLAETLEHHTPQTDAEARTLLSLCRNLVERKHVRVLDGCVSIALSRHRHYLVDQRPGGAVHWLLTGMELESLVLCDGAENPGPWQRDLSSGVCYRILVTSCMATAQSLLKGLLGDEEGVALVYARAQEMVAAHEESKLASFVPAVKVLEHVVEMAKAIVERTYDTVVASSIVSCLEEKVSDEDDGVVSSLARSSMHWDLLRLAHLMLDRTVEPDFSASFDVRGMQVLLERFTIITASREVERLEPLSVEETNKMRLALANGLMRAFVAENSKKKNAEIGQANSFSVTGVCAADLGKYSRDKQEKAVKMMLDI